MDDHEPNDGQSRTKRWTIKYQTIGDQEPMMANHEPNDEPNRGIPNDGRLMADGPNGKKRWTVKYQTIKQTEKYQTMDDQELMMAYHEPND